MTEAQIARQVAALPQDSQRLVLDMIAALKPKPAPAAQSRRKRPSVLEKYAGSVSGPSDLSTNKAYRRAWKKPTA
jgi:hypothetical protein